MVQQRAVKPYTDSDLMLEHPARGLNEIPHKSDVGNYY
jgi:hypothetical protein